MKPEVLAIVGLACWIWSHELRHNYERNPNRLRLVWWAIVAVAAMVLTLSALVTAVL